MLRQLFRLRRRRIYGRRKGRARVGPVTFVFFTALIVLAAIVGNIVNKAIYAEESREGATRAFR